VLTITIFVTIGTCCIALWSYRRKCKRRLIRLSDTREHPATPTGASTGNIGEVSNSIRFRSLFNSILKGIKWKRQSIPVVSPVVAPVIPVITSPEAQALDFTKFNAEKGYSFVVAFTMRRCPKCRLSACSSRYRITGTNKVDKPAKMANDSASETRKR